MKRPQFEIFNVKVESSIFILIFVLCLLPIPITLSTKHSAGPGPQNQRKTIQVSKVLKPATATALVNYGFYCKNSPYFEVDGEPQKTTPPVTISIFKLEESSQANTLRILMKPTKHTTQTEKIPYNYLVLTAIAAENGLPVGHYHGGACSDSKGGTKGIKHWDEFCTKKGIGRGSKWGSTRILFITPNKAKGQHDLGNSKEAVFWSWNQEDGPRPLHIQFRLAAILDMENDLDLFWVNILSPVIEFQSKIQPSGAPTNKNKILPKCYSPDNKLTVNHHQVGNYLASNFMVAKDQTELKVNFEFLKDIFPDFDRKLSSTGTGTGTDPSRTISESQISKINPKTSYPLALTNPTHLKTTDIKVRKPGLGKPEKLPTTELSTPKKSLEMNHHKNKTDNTKLNYVVLNSNNTKSELPANTQVLIALLEDFHTVKSSEKHRFKNKKDKGHPFSKHRHNHDRHYLGPQNSSDFNFPLQILTNFTTFKHKHTKTSTPIMLTHTTTEMMRTNRKEFFTTALATPTTTTTTFHHASNAAPTIPTSLSSHLKSEPPLVKVSKKSHKNTKKHNKHRQIFKNDSSALVLYGGFCKNINKENHLRDLNSAPQTTPLPVDISIFTMTGTSNAFTLHIVVTPKKARENGSETQKYDYLVMMAVDDRGIPSGHFHQGACADARYGIRGVQSLQEYCTRPNVGWGKKWGATRLMYVAAHRAKGQEHLDEESIFWSWHTKDGQCPKFLQFRIALVQIRENELDLFWTQSVYPVMEITQDNIKYVKPEPAKTDTHKCYDESRQLKVTTVLNKYGRLDRYRSEHKDNNSNDTTSNFRPASDQTELDMNPDYLVDLFPTLTFAYKNHGRNRNSTSIATTRKRTTQVFTTAMSATETETSTEMQSETVVYSTTPKITEKSTLASTATPETAITTRTTAPENETSTTTPETEMPTTTLEIEIPTTTATPETEMPTTSTQVTEIPTTTETEIPTTTTPETKIPATTTKTEIPTTTETEIPATTETEIPTTPDTEIPATTTSLKTAKTKETPSSPKTTTVQIIVPTTIITTTRHPLEVTTKSLNWNNYRKTKSPKKSKQKFGGFGRGIMNYIPVVTNIQTSNIYSGTTTTPVSLFNSKPQNSTILLISTTASSFISEEVQEEAPTALALYSPSVPIRIRARKRPVSLHTEKAIEKPGKENYGRNVPAVLMPDPGQSSNENDNTNMGSIDTNDPDSSDSDSQPNAKNGNPNRPVLKYLNYPVNISALSGTGDFYADCGSSKICIEDVPDCIRQLSCTKHISYDLHEVLVLKLHGVFMIIAWILLIPNAAFVARYFKDTYAHVQLFDKSVWLVGHTGLVFSATVFIVLAMIFSLAFRFQFNYEDLFQDEDLLHVIVGCIVLCFLLIQIIIGIIRSLLSADEAGRCRCVLNWAHFLVGFISYIIALILISRAHLMTKSFSPCSDGTLVLILVLWSFLWHAVISIHTYIKGKRLHLDSFKAILPFPIPKFLKEENSLPGNFFRTNVFAFHACGLAIISAMIFLPYLISRRSCSCVDVLC